MKYTSLFGSLLLLIANVLSAQSAYPWQETHARVLPTGDLEYAPQTFSFEAGDSIRYIDYEAGDDANHGTRARPWKHHPWDAAATGRAASDETAADTFVFKGGVTYRGAFRVPSEARGTAGQPIRLTRDPSWGEGPAVISGAEPVNGWTRQRHPAMPEDQTVWATEVNFLPRTLWMTNADQEPVRIKLARWPNWEESDSNDLMAEWPTWDQPKWWTERNKMKVGKTEKHVGIAKSLPRPLSALEGGTVWTEWGIVMGSPYPAEIEAVNEELGGIAFRGPWTYNRSERIITGNRYYLEDLPQFLDQPGEFWVEKTGKTRGRLFVRLPGDADPNQVTLEAGKVHNFFEGDHFEHIRWTGLTFRFGNVRWNYDHPRWMHDQQIAAIRLSGSGDGIVIENNTFEHLPMPLRIEVASPGQAIGSVTIADNIMRDTDHGAAVVANATSGKPAAMGQLGHVDFLRNRLEKIGMRIISGEHGHAVDIRYPETSHLAGNFLHRIAGWGLAVFGGKPSGQGGIDAPLSRHLIHHNRVEDVLLKSNDWGGIETWQGGSHYVFNNVVINALGFKNWIFAQGKKDRGSSFGHAYYMDGSFKNYLFNNIGLGLNNDVATKGVNLTAIQNIISFENWYFNNSFHRFVAATRQQKSEAGRFRYLGNVFSDVSEVLFRHADPKDAPPDPNAAHYTQGGDFDYPTLAYAGNVYHDIEGDFGVFEETGAVYEDGGSFSAALEKLNAKASSVGTLAEQTPLQAPSEMDWRPVAGSAAMREDIRVFVPWALARPVGEWQFTLNRANPAEVIDEHWFMTAVYDQRQHFKDTPRYSLIGEGIEASNYVESPLANWTRAALKLDGENQFLRVPHASLPQPSTPDADATETDPKDGLTKTEMPFGTIRHPAEMSPGQSEEVIIELDQAYPGQQLGLHIHWMKADSWGGFSEVTRPRKLGETRYAIDIMPKAHDGLVAYNLLPYLSPNGNWNEKTQNAGITIPVAAPKPLADAGPDGPWSVDIRESGLIVEAHFKTLDRDGVLISKMHDGVGYELALVNGDLVFRVGTNEGQSVSVAIGATAIADGEWHHVLAEMDRDRGKLHLHLDADGVSPSVELPADFSGSLSNPAEFLVGGGPGKEGLAVTLDFLRVAAGTLADSKTTIDELHRWTFDGPHYRDFTGHDRRQQNAAGALAD